MKQAIPSVTPIVLQASELAQLLGISRSTFWKWQSSGRLGPRPRRINRVVLWSRAELTDWLNEGCPPRGQW